MQRGNSVQEQNERLCEAIRSAVDTPRHQPKFGDLLHATLKSKGLIPDQGLLVKYRQVPDQQGLLHRCTWLTLSRRFFELDLLTDWKLEEVLDVELFEDATDRTDQRASVPGVGKSFGALALEALGAKMSPNNRMQRSGSP